MFEGKLRVHGHQILVESFDSVVITDLEHDFHYFINSLESTSEKSFQIRVLPKSIRSNYWVPFLKTKRSQLFFSPKGEQRICFFNKAWVRYFHGSKRCYIYCDDSKISYEVVYLVLLSFIGEALDLEGAHRIHGMGFTFQGQGVVLLAPSGGGKSTLAMELLKKKDVSILSDDTPVLRFGGKMFAFPQRIALKIAPDVDGKFIRKFTRVHHGEKFVVGSEYFADKIVPEAEIHWLVFLEKEKGACASIQKISSLSAIWPVMKWLVLGYETPQIWELYLRFSAKDIKLKTKILGHRFLLACDLLWKSPKVKLVLSADAIEGGKVLQKFLKAKSKCL